MDDEKDLGVTQMGQGATTPTEITPLERAQFRMRCLELAATQGLGEPVEEARKMMAFIMDSPGPPPPPPPPHQ